MSDVRLAAAGSVGIVFSKPEADVRSHLRVGACLVVSTGHGPSTKQDILARGATAKVVLLRDVADLQVRPGVRALASRWAPTGLKRNHALATSICAII